MRPLLGGPGLGVSHAEMVLFCTTAPSSDSSRSFLYVFYLPVQV